MPYQEEWIRSDCKTVYTLNGFISYKDIYIRFNNDLQFSNNEFLESMGVCLTLLECTCLREFISPHKKREGGLKRKCTLQLLLVSLLRTCWSAIGEFFPCPRTLRKNFLGSVSFLILKWREYFLATFSVSKLSCIIIVVVFQVSLVLVFMVGVIVYKLLIYRPLSANPSTRARAPQIANITGAFVNLTIIMILSRVCSVYFIYACL